VNPSFFSQIATVGYGDFTPKTQLGQLVAMATIIVALVVLPIQITHLASLRYSFFSRAIKDKKESKIYS
jgi:hypothetical protein